LRKIAMALHPPSATLASVTVRAILARASSLRLAAALALALAACGGAQIPKDARTTVLSLDNLDCSDCGHELAKNLGERPGVYKTKFDNRTAELTVVAAPSFDVFGTARTLAKGEEYRLELGAGKGNYIAWSKPPEGADIQTVAKDGADVPDLAPHVVRGKVTVIDFSAIWCDPCRKLDEHMLATLQKRNDVAYRKLDIGDWDTPLAQRYLKNVPALPYVLVYGKNGEKVDSIAGLDLARLDAAIGRGAQGR
jgi:thiol-disulfide isomerase/thioredoxin